MNAYTNLQEIGSGSFAKVYKATASNGLPVAIKTVNRSSLNKKLQQNLELEIHILNTARHRNKTETEINIVMEFCMLGDLSQFIKRKGEVGEYPSCAGLWGGLDEFVVRYLLGQLAASLELLRTHNIVHRDMKPQNIFLALPNETTRKYESFQDEKLIKLPILKLGDFGFARSLERESLASTLCGSPLYMAPEILRGEKYDAKTDLWSVGAILYEMITGKTPFRAQNHIELLRKIDKGDGWIRFPDEAPDEHVGYQPREYHGGIQRPSLQQRKSLAYVPTSQPITHVGSLGSSPRTTSGIPKNLRQRIPEEWKNLIRRLLKRNPVERMTFEEFFIHPLVKEARDLDSRAQQLLSAGGVDMDKQIDMLLEAPFFEPSPKVSNLDQQVIPDTAGMQAPFPGYTMDPDWMKKVMVEPKLPSLQSTFPKMNLPSNNLSRTPTIDPPIAKAEFHTSSSFGSSLGSIEFSSDEDHGKVAQPAPEKEEKSSKELVSSDDFVVVETGKAEVNWHPPVSPSKESPPIAQPRNSLTHRLSNSSLNNGYGSSPLGNPAFISPLSTSSPDKPYFSPKAMDQLRKARLFGSLRADQSTFGIRTITHVIEPEPNQFFGPLPYVIDFSALSADEKNQIEQLNLSAARALCVTELANQMLREFDSLTDSNSSSRKGSLRGETLELIKFALGLWKYSINLASSLYNEYKNSKPPDTLAILKNILFTVNQLLSSRYNECLAAGERLGEEQIDFQGLRYPHRIIYETSLTTAKHGALAELKSEPFEGLYKTSVLLLQALLQPPFDDSVEKLDQEESKVVQGFLNQLYVRLYKK